MSTGKREQLLLDDRDSSIIYTGNWGQSGNVSIEFQGTTTFGAPVANKSTIASLNFKANKITVLGTVGPSSTVISSYTLDGGAPSIFNAESSPKTLYYQSFYSANGLDPTIQHTLVIQPLQNVLFLDMIILVVPGTISDNASSSSTSDPLPPSTQATTVIQGTASASLPATPESIPSSSLANPQPFMMSVPPPSDIPQKSQNNGGSPVAVGVIVGGTLGGLCLVLALVFAIIYSRRRLRLTAAKQRDPYTAESQNPAIDVLPYLYKYGGSGTHQNIYSKHMPPTAALIRQNTFRGGRSSKDPQSSEVCLSPTTAYIISAFLANTRQNSSISVNGMQDGPGAAADPPPSYDNRPT